MSIRMKSGITRIIIFSCALFILNNANALDITIEQGVEIWLVTSLKSS